MPFQINGSSPPANCAPVGSGWEFKHPEAQGSSGLGKPCGAIGYPSLTIRFSTLSVTGWEWYSSFVGTDLSALLTSLQVWDQHKAGGPGWTTYSSAYMHRPTHNGFYYGYYRDVVIHFTEIQ